MQTPPDWPPFETLALEVPAPHILIVRLNRPEVANALSTHMGRDLLALWASLTEDSRGIRCVVFTATGGRVFCAGGDLKERNGMTDAAWQAQHEIFERAYWALMDCPIPVIAAVNASPAPIVSFTSTLTPGCSDHSCVVSNTLPRSPRVSAMARSCQRSASCSSCRRPLRRPPDRDARAVCAARRRRRRRRRRR